MSLAFVKGDDPAEVTVVTRSNYLLRFEGLIFTDKTSEHTSERLLSFTATFARASDVPCARDRPSAGG